MAGIHRHPESSEHEPIFSNAEHDTGDGGEDSTSDDEGNVHIASQEEKKNFWWRNALTNAFFILAWFLFATVLSVYNKWLFSPDHYNFPYPLFVTTIHMFIQFLLATLLRYTFSRRFVTDKRPTLRSYGIKATPPAVATGVDIGLSNVSLKTITLSFYTMCKSSSLIFVLLFAFLFRLEQFSVRLVVVMLIIFTGVLLMVASETAFVLSGFLLVVFASVCSGLRWSLTQVAMQDKSMGLDNPPSTIFWLSPATAVTVAVISIAWEGWVKVFSTPFFATVSSTVNTLLMFIAPGILAFCMVLSEYYIIQRAGVIPMSIAGIAKEVSTITISAWFFGDELTPVNITGVVITVFGIALFTYHKYRKTVDSHVALDEHGNVIQLNGESRSDQGMEYDHDVELTASSCYVRPIHSPIQEDCNGDFHQHLLFSAEGLDDGEEDAEEIRSFRSSKLNWGDKPSKTRDV
ncbi:TPT-domain-containing protein [Boletus edulis]|uniref:Triose-phosphate transporter family-domain-containing protein n=1 Tax=Boletus edulis BED1 TaxID=1328754 RepID=A0AAD4BW74_BOLED|nr:TPT-domain-containing protein [Boletus edulis]KAF8441714.1 triose-phosphate transporter family-domain-containing protein [Boletus edulis BED1]